MTKEQIEAGRECRERFLKKCPGARTFFELFEHLPSTFFYAKDERHRYVGVNHLVLRDVFGLESLDGLLGRTDSEFQPPALAEAYHAEDRRVMESRQALPGQVWLVPHVKGAPKWYVSTKAPMFDAEGEVVGIAGVMYSVDSPKERVAYFRELAPVIAHMEQHFSESVSMREMAKMVGLSSTRFNLRFRQILHMSPSEYQLRLRIVTAQRMLTLSDKTMAEIAVECGFCDQSHFGKRFLKATGMSPKSYRSQFR
ncbi:helix-turn-helix domain-containing protein [Haloferula chungangensis]|uniref:Helix-turn-helix domain-containing protein n=1 Tax=Haloferula chungangensis TaxID=1048331 RepID=A0ABW2L774_9BACT